MLVAEQTTENAKKLSIKEIQDFRITRQDPFLIKLHNKPFSLCSNPFSRCRAWPWCATEDDVKKISQVMAQIIRKLENWNAPDPGPEVHSILCEVVGSDEEFSNGICVFGTPRAKKPSRGACQTPSQKRGDWRRNANRKEKVGSLLRLWIWTHSLQCLFILRFPELVKRITQDLHTQQRSCSATHSKQLASGLRI